MNFHSDVIQNKLQKKSVSIKPKYWERKKKEKNERNRQIDIGTETQKNEGKRKIKSQKV